MLKKNTLYHKSSLNRSRLHELMWNPVSWNLTLKEVRLLAKLVLKYENSIYVDPLANIPIGEI